MRKHGRTRFRSTDVIPDETKAYTPSQGRRFALTVSAAFAVIAAIGLWRDRQTLAMVTASLAALLSTAAVAIPSRLAPVERAWMGFAHAISRVTTPVFMGIVYFLVLTPAGLIRRTFGRNPLVHLSDAGTYWAKRSNPDREVRRRRMERQF